MAHLQVKDDALKQRRGSFEGEYSLNDVQKRVAKNEQKLVGKLHDTICGKLDSPDRPVTGIVVVPLSGQVISNAAVDKLRAALAESLPAIIVDDVLVFEAFVKIIYHEKVI